MARWWAREGDRIRCDLCPHLCWLGEGGLGLCGVRKNERMELCSLNYGKVCVATVDNIEKKPIFHFRPGSTLYSVGTVGCNLDCDNCQNFQLARSNPEDVPSSYFSPKALIREALKNEVDGIAWTFNEPVVWAEYVIDTSRLAKRNGLYSMVNTNGFIQGNAREALLEAIDVIKVDIKSFREDTYSRICRGALHPVLETCERAVEKDVHLEVAYLMIPGVNDSKNEMAKLFEWIVDRLGAEVPLHLFRFSPAFRMMNLKKEPIARMREARSAAMAAGLIYIYFGGVVSPEEQNTLCPHCGSLLVSRVGKEPAEKVFVKKAQMSRFCPSYSDVEIRLEGGRCPSCGEAIRIRFS